MWIWTYKKRYYITSMYKIALHGLVCRKNESFNQLAWYHNIVNDY